MYLIDHAHEPHEGEVVLRLSPSLERDHAIYWMSQEFKSPTACRVALSIACSEYESYGNRFFALKAVEQTDKSLARRIAEKWTHDQRCGLRDYGRDLLSGRSTDHP